MTALVNAPGPLQKYKDEIVRVIDHLLSYSELRDFMAHGLVMLTPTADKNPRLEYRMYRPQSNKMLALGTIKTDLNTLILQRQEMTRFTQHVIRLFSKIYLAEGIDD